MPTLKSFDAISKTAVFFLPIFHKSHSIAVQTCLAQNTSVSTPNSLCPYFQIFDQIFCRCTTSQSKQNSVKAQFFYHSSCKNCVNSHLQLYRCTALRQLYLFTSAKVILDQRPQNTFSKTMHCVCCRCVLS